ncbi:hypothetical protein ACFL27_11940 [candidate division CSSED10-310 bacterium]|uniref:VWFA domain-containing protein n=1 Tax=candidate division CSSED10-310 bacterium TaxID=2855610 RepID=A0ABV6YXF5_UNCC1
MKAECQHVQETVCRDPSTLEGFSKHAAQCPDCNEFFMGFRELMDKLPPKRLAATEELLQQTLTKISQSEPRVAYKKYKRQLFLKSALKQMIIVVPIVLLILALTTPSLMRSRMGANEAAVYGNLSQLAEKGRDDRVVTKEQAPPPAPKSLEVTASVPLEGKVTTLGYLSTEKPEGTSVIRESLSFADESKPGADLPALNGIEMKEYQRNDEARDKTDMLAGNKDIQTAHAGKVTTYYESVEIKGLKKKAEKRAEVSKLEPARESEFDEEEAGAESAYLRPEKTKRKLRSRELARDPQASTPLSAEEISSNKTAPPEKQLLDGYRQKNSKSESFMFRGGSDLDDIVDPNIQTGATRAGGGLIQAACFWDFLPRFGFGILDYKPEVWQGITLDHPVYFQNTYIGGNARLKYYSTLLSQNRTYAEYYEKLNDLSMLYPQPYDPPVKGAMALYAHLDRSSLAESTRLFLQIGLRGTDQFTWRRPPVIIVILDLLPPGKRDASDTFIAEMGSRLDYYDAIGVMRTDDIILPVSVDEFNRSFNKNHDAARPPETEQALWSQLRSVFQSASQVHALQNKRLIILADGAIQSIHNHTIHDLLLQEINTSVVSFNTQTIVTHAATAQAGDGNLHHIVTADDVITTAQEELSSLEKVVSRALRLSIQLAPDVKLIQVIGSRPLGVHEKERVKQAEISVDKGLARTLGIAQDRGDDDPGLQTIIPYFYGGDEHIILIELEAAKAGPIAEVKLKFKDMVDMRNSTLRTAVSLRKTPIPATPQQETVAKNIISISTALLLNRLQKASYSRAEKLQLVRQFLTNYQSLPPTFFQDPAIARDREILQQIQTLLQIVPEHSAQFVEQAMTYTEMRKSISQHRR